MKRKKVLGKNLTFLIVGVLFVLAFVRGTEPIWLFDIQIWALIGVFAVCGIWTLKSSFSSVIKSIKESIDKKRSEKVKSDFKYVPLEIVLLRHVNYRISAYLKSVYPDVTWEWEIEEPEKVIAEGGIGKIRLYGIADFDYANFTFDQLARLDCEMIRTMPFSDKKEKNEPESKPNNPDIDPEIWYNIQGKKVIEACVADLNSRGHANLYIKENGAICFHQEGAEVVTDRISNLPGKGLWQALVKIIEKQGLSASATDDYIKVSW